MSGGAVKVEHDAKRKRFVAQLPEGEGELAYAEPREGVLDLQHTFVPDAARGRGVGEALVTAALAHARASDARIVPTCPFVHAYIDEHQEHASLLLGDG